MKRIILIFALVVLIPLGMSAQKTVTVSGEYTYYAPSNITIDQAKFTALERAKNQLIADEFGTVVGVNNTSMVSNVNGESEVSFLSIGESEVKGEWLETRGEPSYSISFEQNMLVVKVSVKGVIREIKSARIPFEARILRNGTDDRYESDKFTSGDGLFISFETPENGYLTVYIYDGQIVSRLLPLYNSNEGSFDVKGGEKYILFQKNDKSSEYNLACEHPNEMNRIYIIYSPNKFSRAVDSKTGKYLPPSLSFEDFQHWLSKSRKQDVEMGVMLKDILITK